MSDDNGTGSSNNSAPRGGLGKRLLDLLTSLKFALSILFLIAVACAAGTLFPQGSAVAGYLKEHPEAEGKMAFFDAIGLTHVFSSWWFIALLCILAASLSVCALRRFLSALNRGGKIGGRPLGSLLTHTSMLLILLGGVVRIVWGQRGMIGFHEGQRVSSFQREKGPAPLPFSVELVKFEIDHYKHSPKPPRIVSEHLGVVWPGRNLKAELPVQLGTEHILAPQGEKAGPDNSLRVTVLRREPDFVIDMETREVGSRSKEPRNPAILVQAIGLGSTNTSWLFARHPDFNMHSRHARPKLNFHYHADVRMPPSPRIKDWKSTLRILEGDTVVKEKTIEVNAPLSYKGYTFYQSGYDQRDPTWTVLQVVKDPGVPLVYAGFALMIVGLAIVFYVYPGVAAPARPAEKKEDTP